MGNYYGWHLAERWWRCIAEGWQAWVERWQRAAEGWQTVATKYMSTPIDQRRTKQRNLKEIG